MRIIAHVDMDAFFAAVEQKMNPFLRGKPIFVSGNTARDSVVAACSYEAKKFGVKSGMSIYEALDLCPGAIIVRGNPEKYIDASRRLYETLCRFTEKVELYSIDEAFLDITPCIKNYTEIEKIGQDIKQEVKNCIGLTCSVGIGPNKVVAKIASDMCKPDGLLAIPWNKVQEFMESLPVKEIPGIGPKTTEKLLLMGIERCGQVTGFPIQFWKEKFGVYGENIFWWCSGRGNDTVITQSPEPKSFGHSYTLMENTSDRTILQSILFRLSHQVGVRMRSEGYSGNVISVYVRFADFTSFNSRKTLPFWFNDEQTIFRFAWELASKSILLQQVRLLGVSVSGVHKRYQMHLFGNERLEFALRTMDTINNEYGTDTVFPAMMLYERQKYMPVAKTHAFQFSALKKFSSGRS